MQREASEPDEKYLTGEQLSSAQERRPTLLNEEVYIAAVEVVGRADDAEFADAQRIDEP